jgi:membrane fusion protein (multidrug efflux system)
VYGASRPQAVQLPQRAVQQGSKGHYVWVIGTDGKARQRLVEVGDWNGDDWFISDGLKPGERVIVDGAGRVTPTAPLRVAQLAPQPALAQAGAAPRKAALRAESQQ